MDGRAFALCYDWVMTPAERLGLARLRRSLLGRARGRVLEVGAGTGLNLSFYPSSVEEVVLTDPEPALLERAGRRLLRLEGRLPASLVLADAQRLPFRSKVFDTVVATLVFCTVPRPEEALPELVRVLRPGGLLLMLEHTRLPWRPLAHLQSALTPAWRRVARGCHLDRDPLPLVRAVGLEPVWVRRSLGGLLLRLVARKPSAPEAADLAQV